MTLTTDVEKIGIILHIVRETIGFYVIVLLLLILFVGVFVWIAHALRS